MDSNTMYAKIEDHIKKQMPFVVYNHKHSDELQVFFQKNDKRYEVSDYSGSGFVFAPFDHTRKAVVIPSAQSEYGVVRLNDKVNNVDHMAGVVNAKGAIDKDVHLELVSKGVQAIEKGIFKKVVLSRKEEVLYDEVLDPILLFQRLVSAYPGAFVYLWFHPKVGTWLGATPETLFSSTGNEFSTMALAGTQPYNSTTSVIWGPKELEEQEMVTEFILKELKPIASDIVSSKTYTHRAGTLLHLRTDIKGSLNFKKSGIKDIVEILHPTPAVCGLPKLEAKNFISDHEGYDRKYYTGFLGELNLEKEENSNTNLFVNLRCMEIEGNRAVLYVGGGVTKDSIPEKEWEETVRKTETMKKVLF
ncbi:isochorismate synthase [Aquimarina sp. D1M17]|uniref:isochorismate synthase n=1 Tax=Aquimarina acroporae TaxID=2937283 RepID=UPI0020BFD5B6|nr:isochorismate synthase [Aquimarina acroporae]MCK8520378.1 isochorismate synthase [Aquimarina acroporae]